MKEKKRVAIVFGGVSTEHEVSIVSAGFIAANIDLSVFEPLYVGIDKQGSWFMGEGVFDYLRSGKKEHIQRVTLSPDPSVRGFIPMDPGEVIPVDIIFPVMHGPGGEDGTIQGLFELADIPYVGCNTMASAIAMDKDMTKRVLAQRGISVVKGTCVNAWTWKTDRQEVLKEISDSLEFPLFIKPATMGSSIGITRVLTPDEIPGAADHAFKYAAKVVVEQAVDNALEIEVAIIGNKEPKASVPGQVIPEGDFYDFNEKYINTSARLVVPANIGSGLKERMEFIALDAFDAIGGAGLARVDFLVSEQRCYVNEINTMPGFTSISMYPRLWEATGVSPELLITLLLDLACQRHDDCKSLVRTIEVKGSLGV
ncbi:MAG: D-alanine--D-alanine ligase family protein [Thermodesulfobacteriota bacterium]|nr:D-alanine--D-alanine ligase family protein [Thermodesulfobacteriota bacterium]